MSEERPRVWPKPTPDELLSALRSAGWLLEQETAAALRHLGFDVTPRWAVRDLDDPNKSREVDVFAGRRLFGDGRDGLTISMYILVECKESSMPYALLGQEGGSDERPPRHEEVHLLFDRIKFPRDGDHPQQRPSASTTAIEYLGLNSLTANPWAGTFEADHLVRLDKKSTWSATNDALMQEVMLPMAKTITSLRKRTKRHTALGPYDQQTGSSVATRGNVVLYFPLVVTSAPLFRVSASTNPAEVVEAPWVRVKRRFDMSSVQGEFRVTVVNQDAFASYVRDQVLGFANAVVSIAEKSPERFLGDTDLLYVPPK